MNECLTIDDDDEEDHRWFFSCPDPLLRAERGIPAKGPGNFLSDFFSDGLFMVAGEKKQANTLISGNRDYNGLITG